jgi:glycosyltransferase involved in cell wall biosynthesis
MNGLRKTIQSVVQQTCRDFEYILIDGGSNDGSVELIQEYESQIDQWISEPDHGIYHAMNKGVLIAQGKSLLFLNSGDVLADNGDIEKLKDSALWTSRKNDVIYHGIMRRGTPEKHAEVRVPPGLPIAYLIENSLPHPATFISKSLFEKRGLYDEQFKMVSDWKFFVQCYFKGVKFEPIQILISYFDIYGMSSDHTKLKMERKKVFDQLWMLKITWNLILLYRMIKYTWLKRPIPQAQA